uniref:Aldehyde dehydrogenase n=1 Tax=Hirondellea gigas TaxID=1518452 RepID=A0A6A7G8G7_9CRUS
MGDEVKEIELDCGGTKVKVNPGLFINGKFIASEGGKKFATIDPSNGKVIAEVYEASASDIDKAVDAAEAAFRGKWGSTSANNRGRLLQALSALLMKNRDEIARIEALDNGKTFAMASRVDIPGTADCFNYYGGWATKRHGKTLDLDKNTFAYTRHEPIGVCGCIIPWNFPLLMAAWKLGPLLACGNTAVLKSSEKTPLSALYLAKLIREAGFPPGTVNIVSGYGPTTGEAISSHMRIRKVAFTGSARTGRLIMKSAANSNLKKISLELGGKSPNIIFDDCNLGQALAYSIPGLLFNAGQVCAAGTRLFVQEGIYDKFVAAFTKSMKSMKLGNQWGRSTMQGPQVDKIQFDNILALIESGKKAGATVAVGGKRHGDQGYYIEPTLFTDVTDDMEIVKKEIFGPVGVVLKFKTEEEVIRRANDTEYGLAAAVFTTDVGKAIRVSNALEAGTVWVNQYAGGGIQCAFGGYKQSGIGRECGEYALELYTEVKQVIMNISKM